ncbi:hypothetical protein [Thermoactinomyces mirandus]|nr:hypothetical protein [Thermoactinomyces mirandus]
MRRQRIVSDDSTDWLLGIVNAILFSLPFWGLIYFGLRIIQIWN